MNALGSLLRRAEANRGVNLDQRWLILDLLRLYDRVINSLEITENGVSAWTVFASWSYALIAILDNLDVPTVGFEALHDVLSKRDVGLTVDGDVCIKKCSNRDQSLSRDILTVVVVELETSFRISFAIRCHHRH